MMEAAFIDGFGRADEERRDEQTRMRLSEEILQKILPTVGDGEKALWDHGCPIEVLSVSSAGVFWIKEAKSVMGTKTKDDHSRKEMEEKLQKDVMNPPAQIEPEEREMVAAFYAGSSSKKWQRAVVEEVHQLDDTMEYTVMLVDRGYSIRVPDYNIRSLPDWAKSLPYQVMVVKLFGVVPTNEMVDLHTQKTSTGLGINWSPAATNFVATLLKDCSAVRMVKMSPNIIDLQQPSLQNWGMKEEVPVIILLELKPSQGRSDLAPDRPIMCLQHEMIRQKHGSSSLSIHGQGNVAVTARVTATSPTACVSHNSPAGASHQNSDDGKFKEKTFKCGKETNFGPIPSSQPRDPTSTSASHRASGVYVQDPNVPTKATEKKPPNFATILRKIAIAEKWDVAFIQMPTTTAGLYRCLVRLGPLQDPLAVCYGTAGTSHEDAEVEAARTACHYLTYLSKK